MTIRHRQIQTENDRDLHPYLCRNCFGMFGSRFTESRDRVCQDCKQKIERENAGWVARVKRAFARIGGLFE